METEFVASPHINPLVEYTVKHWDNECVRLWVMGNELPPPRGFSRAWIDLTNEQAMDICKRLYRVTASNLRKLQRLHMKIKPQTKTQSTRKH